MIVLIVQLPDRFLELLEVVGEDVINVGRDVQLIIAYHTDDAAYTPSSPVLPAFSSLAY